MTETAIRTDQVPPITHEEAMPLAEAEYRRVLDLAEQVPDEQWSAPTECTGWDVQAVLGHLVGMMERLADPHEAARQDGLVAERVAATGGLRLDCLTDLQVREHAHLTPAEVRAALRRVLPGAVAGRRDRTPGQLAATYDTGLPGESPWTFGYLLDVILTRDPWMHRVDVARAVGADLVLTPEHDGRVVADIVAEWARRHGQPFTLVLDGPAGGAYVAGAGGPDLRMDAVQFCRVVSGRGAAAGLLATPVPF